MYHKYLSKLMLVLEKPRGPWRGEMMLALLGRIHDSNTTLPFDDLHVALSLCWRRREGQEEPEKRRIEQERPDENKFYKVVTLVRPVVDPT